MISMNVRLGADGEDLQRIQRDILSLAVDDGADVTQCLALDEGFR